MKSRLSSIIGFTFGMLLLVGCGDDAVPGFNGDVICASDNSDVGQTIDCPSGDQTLDFCVDTGSGSCYYEIGGEQVNCGNCIDGSGSIATCAQQAIELCD